jgi:hypothetical protein
MASASGLGGAGLPNAVTAGLGRANSISFAFMSVAIGIFGTYDDVLQNSGPVGIWLWIIAAVGQSLVALVPGRAS